MTQQKWVEIKQHGGESPRWFTGTLWHMMGITAWWRMLRAYSFRMSPSKTPMAVTITGAALCISAAGLVQSAIFGRRLRKVAVEHDPVFVIGHWRSGTTHLHELLSLDPRYAFPSTFEVMAPHHC